MRRGASERGCAPGTFRNRRRGCSREYARGAGSVRFPRSHLCCCRAGALGIGFGFPWQNLAPGCWARGLHAR
eukprot:10095848-Lingulodinium_polyedra.AAC.1